MLEQFSNVLLADSNGKSSNGFTKKKNIHQGFHPGGNSHRRRLYHLCLSVVSLTDPTQSRGSIIPRGTGWGGGYTCSTDYNRSFIKFFFLFYSGGI